MQRRRQRRPRRRTPRTGGIASLTVVLGLGGSLLAVPALAGGAQASRVEWKTCPEDVVAEAAPTRLRCGTVSVPVDYADPGGERIDLMISRLASTNPDKRRGVLMLNPGGPGGSGLAQAALLVSRGLPSSVTDSYDIIGMDTRGLGRSAPVRCGIPADSPYIGNIPPYAVDDAAVTARAKVVKEVAERCARNDRDGRLRHITTANTARDLDRIRAALGEEKTSYLGYSYGTALGAAYASMFPERSDRIVLDSNIGDTHLDRDGLRRYALGMEQAFPAFAKWAAARHASYGLGRTPEQVRQTYLTLAGRLDRTPAAGFDGGLFRQFTFAYLYKASQYPKLAQQWQALDSGAGSAPAANPTASSAPSPADNALSVFLAVTCNDVRWPRDVDTYRRGVAQDRERYPLFGAATANITPCAFWPYAPAEPPVTISDEGPRNVLLVQNLRDPATPHQGGRLLREKFKDRSRLLGVDDSGHGAYVLGDDSCALNTTTRYLVEGAMPAKDTVCRAG
ncbi:alpha/beta hydrolase [Streptomyces lanatus]|uniref:Alpha/beta hydrolase n=1 Tax=Streptomyces lanatus TaxID=66900 RepID=A0ABV1XJU2_9ACTN|nr:alpha/beta hydrolase [Streptomyces lanatus]GHG90859.1 alpha/beta hydrolase [Streptomyces lanatus]